jgi:hypothetical protein
VIRVLALVALIGLAIPVSAQTVPPATDLIAIIIAGLASGETAEMPIRGIVASTGAGEFTLTGEGTVVTVHVTETAPCIFALTSAIPEYPTVTLHIDANKINAMSVVPSGERDDLHRYDLTLTGEGAVMIEVPDGTFPAPDGPTQIVSTMELEEIESAIEAFRGTHCPGLAG